MTQCTPEATQALGASSDQATEAARPPRLASDKLISITDIRRLFKLGRTAAYELTRRPGFPDPVPISPRCYRWWASEVDAYAAALRRAHLRTTRQTKRARPAEPAIPPQRITGKVRTVRIRKEAS